MPETLEDPLERPVWSAFTGRQSRFAIRRGGAVRVEPQVNVFAAIEDGSDRSLADLAALVRQSGETALVDASPAPNVTGIRVVSTAAVAQMVSERPAPDVEAAGYEITPLAAAHAGSMRSLASLTQPGPFLARTHELGDFFGVWRDGRLAAMAGERMQPEGYCEVSGVCTHPDFRGQGYAGALTAHVAGRIRARGETPFLHVYPSNTGAIRLYEQLGFAFRRQLVMTVLVAD